MTDTGRQAAYDILRVLGPAFPGAGCTVIGIAGESGCGKTTTAHALAEELSRREHATVVLHQDDYFLRPPRANHEHRRHDLSAVGPQEVNLDLLQAHVTAFRSETPSVIAPAVDYDADRFSERLIDLTGIAVLIVEGTYVLQLDGVDHAIFLEATHLDTRARRQSRARDLDEPFVNDVLAIEHEIIQAQRARADILIDREFRVSLRRHDALS